MKIIIAIILTLALVFALAACGGNGTPSDTNTTNTTNTTVAPSVGSGAPAGSDKPGETGTGAESEAADNENVVIIPGKRADRVVNPSELIGEEDAIRILGEGTKLYDQDTPYGLSQSSLMCRYGSYDGTTELEFIIGIMQDATLREGQSIDHDIIKSGGVTGYNQRTGKAYADAGETPLAGIGEWAFIADNSRGNGRNAAFAYEAYNVTMALTIFQGGDKAEAKAWMTEKLTEAGKLAVGRLADIVG